MTTHNPESPETAVHRLCAKLISEGYRLAALHHYRGAHGETMFYRVRLIHPQRKKVILPMHHNGRSYVLREPAAPPAGKVLYGLPQLLAVAGPVYVVEGEACADDLAARGVLATTTGGAGTAEAADWTPLLGREVRIWRDNDEAGERYARAVTAMLHRISASIEWIDLTPLALPEHGDCVDWLAEHSDATADTVDALARVPTPDPVPQQAREKAIPRAILRAAADVEPQAVDWLWPGWLASGKLHLIGGAPGTGKTTVAIKLAAIVSTGGLWPDGSSSRSGSVVIWSGEDDDADTLNPRLRAAGADITRVRTVSGVIEDGQSYPFDPARDLEALRCAIRMTPDVRLLVMDPVVSAVPGDSHKNAEVRRGLQPLVDLAQELRCAVVGITHFSKGTSGREPLERITGSLAFGALARVVLVTAKQEAKGDLPGRRVLLRAKCNIGPDGGGFAYDLRQEPLPDFPNVEASRVVWGDVIEGTAREVLADAEAQGEEVEERRDAASWLRQLLADGPVAMMEVRRQAEDAGYAWRTMQRAMRVAGVESRRVGFGGAAVWHLVNRANRAVVAPSAPRSESGADGATVTDNGVTLTPIEP